MIDFLELKTSMQLKVTELITQISSITDKAEFQDDIERINKAAIQLEKLVSSFETQLNESSDWSKIRHDLKTPINAIKGYGELIMEEDLPSDTMQKMKIILLSANNILADIDKIRD